MEHNQQGQGAGRGRRGHFRGRRPDRRSQGPQEGRPSSSNASEQPPPRGDRVDVEQIMRDIRARIAHRHGINLSTAQVQELAARRLEAILDPRNIDPTLLEQLRKAAGERAPRKTPPAAEPAYTFEDTTLFESSRGLLTTIRRLLNPVLKLFFNPNPLIHALNTQVRLNTEQAARETARDEQQAEWNALHYELLRRVVTESARLSLEVQTLTLRVESLAARVDFADRRVREIEAAPPRHQPRHTPEALPATVVPSTGNGEQALPAAPQGAADSAASGDGRPRRRRRRRGRRNGVAPGDPGQPLGDMSAGADGDADEFDDAAEEPTGPDSGRPAASVVPDARPAESAPPRETSAPPETAGFDDRAGRAEAAQPGTADSATAKDTTPVDPSDPRP